MPSSSTATTSYSVDSRRSFCDAERHQVWKDAVSVSSRKRRRAAGEKEQPTVDERNDADEERNGRSSGESRDDGEDSDADPRHKTVGVSRRRSDRSR